ELKCPEASVVIESICPLSRCTSCVPGLVHSLPVHGRKPVTPCQSLLPVFQGGKGNKEPQAYVAEAPVDIAEVDALDVRPLPGIALSHFTAGDVISR
ncbi:MAG: hypothetical protein KAQ74_05555, partial [Dehalococcoidia bacterium]|nr:hypothetical protein [Dehalococcoidia bacterium]